MTWCGCQESDTKSRTYAQHKHTFDLLPTMLFYCSKSKQQRLIFKPSLQLGLFYKEKLNFVLITTCFLFVVRKIATWSSWIAICYVNVENCFLTITKNIAFSRIKLRFPFENHELKLTFLKFICNTSKTFVWEKSSFRTALPLLLEEYFFWDTLWYLN